MRPPRYNESGPFARVWKALNLVWDELRKQKARKGRGIRLHETSDGTTHSVIASEQAEEGGLESKRCYIISTTPTGSNSRNYLTVKVYNEDGYTLSSEILKVAIPYFLRATTYEDQTIGSFIYTTVNGQIRCRQSGAVATAYIAETFFPPYIVGQDIVAIKPQGKTDVTVDDVLLEWVDINNEGRRLKPNQTQLSVCVLEGGVPTSRTITVAGGPVA